MKIIFLTFFLSCSLSCFAQIFNSNKECFTNANANDVLKIDSKVSVYRDSINLDNEIVYKNNYSDDNYYKYIYLGLVSIKFNLIEKQTYNGSTFFVFDKQNFRITNLKGKPYKFGHYIITVNIESTTDNKNCLSIYRLTRKLKLLKSYTIPNNIIIENIKMKGENIYLKDLNGNYWELKI